MSVIYRGVNLVTYTLYYNTYLEVQNCVKDKFDKEPCHGVNMVIDYAME